MKYLGLNITTNFKFKKHIELIINKSKAALNMYFKIFKQNNCLKTKIKLIFYKQMIRSLISYAFPIWFSINSRTMESIRIFERKCLKYCINFTPKIDVNKYRNISNIKLYTKAQTIRIDNFLIKMALNFYNSMANIKNKLIDNILSQNVNINDKNYSIKHLKLLDENNSLYNSKKEIIYYNAKFSKDQYVDRV